MPTQSKNSIQKLRLNLFIAKYANHSRRQADKLIKNKKVSVNGQIITQLPVHVQVNKDMVKVKGKLIRPIENLIYIMFHKPEKTLTTASDPQERTTVFHYFKKIRQRIFSVGRLDWNTEGLLLLTNDGQFSKKVQDPKSKILKTYMVKLDHIPRKAQLEKLTRGVTIPGGRVKAVNIQMRPKAWVRISIQEGKNRQLHFMFSKIGFRVRKLKRVQIGRLKLGSLKQGQARFLNEKDISKIFQQPLKKRIRKRSSL